MAFSCPFQRPDHIVSRIPIAKPDCRAHTTKVINYRLVPEFLAIEKLVRHEIHAPAIVDPLGRLTAFSKLCFHPASGCLVPHLQAHFTVPAIEPRL